MRRWQILAVEDNPQGSPEVEWLVPFVLSRPHPGLGGKELQNLSVAHSLEPFLPDVIGESGIEELEWTLNDPKVTTAERRERIFAATNRWPILDIERTFSEAWALLEVRRKDPPDLLLLDIDLGKGADEAVRLEKIFRDIRSAGAILRAANEFFSFRREGFLARGGLFLLARALQVFRDPVSRPLIVVYSASSDAPSYLHPLALAVEGQFQIVMKQDLKQDEGVRRWLYEQRIRHWIRSGLIKTDAVWQSLTQLREVLAKHQKEGLWDLVAKEWERALREVLPAELGGGWKFATLFAAQLPSILRVPASLSHKTDEAGLTGNALASLREIEGFLGESDFPRALGTFFETTPYALFCHRAVPSEYASLPDPELVERGWARFTDAGRWEVRCVADNDSLVPDISYGQKLATTIARQFEQLPARLKELILHQFNSRSLPEEGENPLVSLMSSRSPWSSDWETVLHEVRESCRYRDFPRESADLLARWTDSEVGRGNIVLTGVACEAPWLSFERVRSRSVLGLNAGDIQLFLEPEERAGAGAVCDLLRAILGNLHHAYPGQAAWPVMLAYQHDDRQRRLRIRLQDRGCGFGLALRTFDFMTQPSDLSVAVRRARGWCAIEIVSGNIRRDPHTREGVDVAEPIKGTCFTISISTYGH